MTASKWLPIFLSFVQDLRISSKEVTTSDERGVKLELWESQRRFLQEIAFGLDADIRDFTNLKSRQLGITTISLAIDVFWLAMHPNLTGALVSDTDKNRGKNRAQIERYTRSLPENYFGNSFDIIQSNDKFTQFSNGSRLDYLVAGTKKKSTAWGEGEGYAYVHETEVAAYGDALGLDSFEESFAQTNPSRLFIRESTAKGFNHFREMYNAAKADGMTKRAFFIGWWACDMNRIERHDPRFVAFGRYAPTREEREKIGLVEQLYQWKITSEQLAWIRWREADPKNDSNLLDQNQPWIESQAFIETGFSFFQTRAIAKDMQELEASDVGYTAYRYNLGTDFFGMTMDQVDDDDQRGEIELKIWEEPVPEGKYLIGADPAYGRNEHKDHHCASVWRGFADKIVQVAEFVTADIEVKHFAWIMAHLAGAYRDCIINLEIGGPGRMIMLEWEHIRSMLKAEMYFQRVRGSKWEDAMDNARWYLYHRPDSMGPGFAANFETTWRTKHELMHQFRGAYATRELEIRSMYLYHEMSLVVQNGNEIGAPESRSESCKDDRVFAAALANRAWINWIRPAMINDGLSYQKVMEKEKGEPPSLSTRMNDQVYRFFKSQQEAAEEAELNPPKTWRSERGLLG